MNPALHTRPTRRAVNSATSAKSNASRSAKSLGLTNNASTPAARARSSAAARSRSEITMTTSAGYSGRPEASSSACRLDPRPDASTPTRRRSVRSVTPPAPRPGRDFAQVDHRLARLTQRPRRGLTGRRGDDDDVADAHVEGLEHLALVHSARLAEGSEDLRGRPGRSRDARAAARREHARQVAGEAAP